MLRTSLLLAACLAPAQAFAPARRPAASSTALFAMASPPEVTRGANSTAVIKLTVAGADTKAAYAKAAQSYAREVVIDGFRPGKAPLPVLEQRLGRPALASRAMETIAETSVNEALQESGVQAIGQAEFVGNPEELVASYEPGAPLEISVKVDVWPELEFSGSISGHTVEVEKPEYNSTAADLAMGNLMERYAATEPKEGASVLGDVLTVDMVGYEYDAGAENGRGPALPQMAAGEDVEVVLEEGRFMPGLVEALVGCVAGDQRDVKVDFPDKPSAGALRGKTALFAVAVKEVGARALPKRDDEFAGRIRPGLTFAELEKEVTAAVNEDAEQAAKQQLGKALDELLLAATDAELPDTMVDQKVKEKFATMLTDFRTNGTPDEEIKKMITKEGYQKYKDIASPNVIKELLVGLAHAKLAEDEGLQVDQGEVNDQVQLLRAQAEREARANGATGPEDVDFDEVRTREKVEATLLAEKVHEFLASKNTVVYTEVSADAGADAGAAPQQGVAGMKAPRRPPRRSPARRRTRARRRPAASARRWRPR